MTRSAFTPTLFDKIVSNLELSGITSEGLEAQSAEFNKRSFRFHSVSDLDRYTEGAVRTTVMRELAWLLNTVNLESSVDLTAYPEVQTSVLNYGVNDMTGKSASSRALQVRAARIKQAIETFEPRIDPESLVVENVPIKDRADVTQFVIRCDITSAVAAIPLRMVTDIEADTGDATVRG